MVERFSLIHGDCLEKMREIPDKSIDMILCDLPYGTTACNWDSIIPFDSLWLHYNRVIKKNGVIALFGSEPFSSHLRISNLKLFKYDWVWKKDGGSNFATVKFLPMKEHETISIFYRKKPTYNQQKQERIGHRKGKKTKTIDSGRINSVYGTSQGGMILEVNELRCPSSVQFFKRERGLHPTQKPVSLLEYLIKTYSNENEVILDNCMGSGSTGVACKNLNRKFIGIEKDDNYFEIARNRIDQHQFNLMS